MDITPRCRSKQVSFTTPYYENSAVVIAKRYLPKRSADPSGKRIGMGTNARKYIQDQHSGSEKLSPGDSYQECPIDLKNGRIDGAFGDNSRSGKRMAVEKNQSATGRCYFEKSD